MHDGEYRDREEYNIEYLDRVYFSGLVRSIGCMMKEVTSVEWREYRVHGGKPVKKSYGTNTKTLWMLL